MKVFEAIGHRWVEITDPKLRRIVVLAATLYLQHMPDGWVIHMGKYGPVEFEPCYVQLKERIFTIDNWKLLQQRVSNYKANGSLEDIKKKLDEYVADYFKEPVNPHVEVWSKQAVPFIKEIGEV